MTDPNEPADPTDADPVTPPPIEEGPSTTGVVVDEEELEEQ